MRNLLIVATLTAILTVVPASAEPVQPDNTGVNERDARKNSLTAQDQGATESDRQISAEIRKSLVDDESLSTYAKNVKIITNGGDVVLRGPVKSQQERALIEEKARKAAGARRVVNELEIAKG